LVTHQSLKKLNQRCGESLSELRPPTRLRRSNFVIGLLIYYIISILQKLADAAAYAYVYYIIYITLLLLLQSVSVVFRRYSLGTVALGRRPYWFSLIKANFSQAPSLPLSASDLWYVIGHPVKLAGSGSRGMARLSWPGRHTHLITPSFG